MILYQLHQIIKTFFPKLDIHGSVHQDIFDENDRQDATV